METLTGISRRQIFSAPRGVLCGEKNKRNTANADYHFVVLHLLDYNSIFKCKRGHVLVSNSKNNTCFPLQVCQLYHNRLRDSIGNQP
ncbi:Uncharacterized protein APZ42_019757 [Daphnia magna]|uniref:Uncharacterized protein n=1 Tax=Daphnia magna TaxID=35525 RepID=A0A164XP30_9CRUS|nr:Uncharacterized protein APZ42_019757 [Daphnia magna]